MPGRRQGTGLWLSSHQAALTKRGTERHRHQCPLRLWWAFAAHVPPRRPSRSRPCGPGSRGGRQNMPGNDRVFSPLLLFFPFRCSRASAMHRTPSLDESTSRVPLTLFTSSSGTPSVSKGTPAVCPQTTRASTCLRRPRIHGSSQVALQQQREFVYQTRVRQQVAVRQRDLT